MQARAEAKYVRVAPRKARLLVDLIRGMNVKEARAQLSFSPKQTALPVLKVLNSAIANAEHNLNANTDDFKVIEVYVNEGPKIKRYKPRAQGRATLIRKRMSHITVVVGDSSEAVVEAAPAPKAEEKSEAKAEKTPAKKAVAKKTSSESSTSSKSKTSSKKTATSKK